jgi:outer membrane protein TolC
MMKSVVRVAVLATLLSLPCLAPAQSAGESQRIRVELAQPAIGGDFSLSLTSAVQLALERNPVLLVDKIRIEQAREKIEQERGTYDRILNFGGTLARRNNIVASRFYPSGFYVDAELAPSASVESRTYSGGRLNVGLDLKRIGSTSNTQTLSPQYSANLAFTFSQALLRDFGRGVNTTRIRIAQKGEEIAELSLFQRISQLIQQVEESYWSLTFLRQDLDAKRRSLEVAQGLLKQNEELFRAGRVANVSVLQARAAVAMRDEEVITAEAEVEKFEDRLKVILWISLSAANVSTTETRESDVAFDEARSLQLALQRRPEVQALQREIEQREIELKFASNQTKPRLDLVTQYSVSGLSGRPNPTCVDPTSVLCIPVGSNVEGSIFSDQTRPAESVTSLFSHNPLGNWSVALKLQVPIGNRTAKAQYSEANLRMVETSTRLRALRDQIEVEIRNAIRETLAARRRIEASRETVRFIEEQLEGTRKQFDAGLTSSYDVLQVLDELDRARTAELRATMDFNIGNTRVRLAEASVLERYNIELTKPDRYTFGETNVVR